MPPSKETFAPPSLALTSLAGATPGHWQVRYWDENLLQGSIPIDPLPEVVGITVHLTFAQRAYAIADWFRAQGTKVILGGLLLNLGLGFLVEWLVDTWNKLHKSDYLVIVLILITIGTKYPFKYIIFL